jgi:hypothetical protein
MFEGSLLRYIVMIIGCAVGAPAFLNAQSVDTTTVLKVINDTLPNSAVIDTNGTPDLRIDEESEYEEIIDDFEADIFNPGSLTPNASGSSELIEYGSVDSNFLDIVHQEAHLYGQAYVKYTDYEVTADYIILNFNTNNIRAFRRDKKSPKAQFKSGEQNAAADEILFNTESQKGLIYGANIVQNDLYIHGAVTKFVKGENDSLHIDDVIYNRNALITSCNLEHPHWGIRTTKLKFIPNRLAVIGPANLELAGIPTPVVAPFAFVPLLNLNNASSGLIYPEDPIRRDPRLGLGIRGLGYYFAINDYVDLAVRSELYARGSWVLNLNSNYRKRYKYSGVVDFEYSRQLIDVFNELNPNVQSSFSFAINHRQDTKAHPYRTIGGSLRFTLNDHDRRTNEDAQSQLNSQINSNFSYAYRLSDNWTFTSAIRHSQNTLNRSISFTLPDVQLRMSRIFPFNSPKTTSANDKWFEKINVQYDGQFENTLVTTDTTLFSSQTLDLFRGGFSHDVDVAASYSLFEHFNFNTSIDYEELWFLQQRELNLDDDGEVVSGVRSGFEPLRNLSVSAGLTTNIFSTIQFKKGFFRGFRHQLRPSLGLSFSPSTEDRRIVFDPNPDISVDEQIAFNPFNGRENIANFNDIENENLFAVGNLQQGGARVTYNFANTVEGKYYSKRDSTEKKFKIFNSLNLSGSYNLQADSLQWSTASLTANTNIFKNITTLSIRGTLDPYLENEQGNRINTTVWSDRKRLVRVENFSINLATNFSLSDLRDLILYGGEPPKNKREAKRDPHKDPELFSWFENARIRHSFVFGNRGTVNDNDWGVQTHSIQMTTGNIPLTDKWGMSVGNLSYNFVDKQFVYPSFSLNRQLHCWNMRLSWQPSADTFTFFIGVSSAPFSDFLKYENGRSAFQSNFTNF